MQGTRCRNGPVPQSPPPQSPQERQTGASRSLLDIELGNEADMTATSNTNITTAVPGYHPGRDCGLWLSPEFFRLETPSLPV